jgi:hypothetical protein
MQQCVCVVAAPQLTHVVRFDVDDRHSRVVGITSLDSRHLYVLLSPSRQQIEVYDKATFGLQRTLNVAGLSDDEWGYNGLTSCVTNNCLYINDWRLSSVFKVQLSPDDREVLKWQVDEMPSGLAVNAACNLLVTSCRANKLLEYTPSGSLVREINLLLYDAELSPFHAIQLSGCDLFVVCLHRALDSMPGDVVEVNSQGRVVTSYKKQLLSTSQHQFDWPRHLAVDGNGEYIFVADYYHGRIVVLSRSSPSRACEMSASIDGSKLRSTRCLCFDNDSLYIGEGFRGGRVFVFDIRRHKRRH